MGYMFEHYLENFHADIMKKGHARHGVFDERSIFGSKK